MPYNTTAIPPRKDPTGQTQLPLTRVKKIIAQDTEINICSNNAAFVITLAAEMFIQHLTTEAQNMAKSERKPRRNIQYKDIANAIQRHDNLEFLEDTVPKTAPFKAVKGAAAATRAKFLAAPGAKPGEMQAKVAVSGNMADDERPGTGVPNGSGKRHKTSLSAASAADVASMVNGSAGPSTSNGFVSGSPSGPRHLLNTGEDDANAQLEMEMQQQARNQDGDVDMTG